MILLGLPNYTSSIIEDNDHDIHIELTPNSSNKPICPECQSKELQSFGKFAKKKASTSRRTAVGKYMADDWCQSYGVPEVETINYGVSIDKLAEMLESGKLRFDV